MRLVLSVSLLILGLAAPVSAACKDNFLSIRLPYFNQIEYRTHDTLSGLGQNEAARRLAKRLKDDGYADVSRSGGTVVGWQGISGAGKPSVLRFLVTGSGSQTRVEAILTAPDSTSGSAATIRAGLCALVATAAG